jgi:hypothetical protein
MIGTPISKADKIEINQLVLKHWLPHPNVSGKIVETEKQA